MESSRPKGNHTIPVPKWWMAAVKPIREEVGSDSRLMADIKRQTGTEYSKFQISRYFAGIATTYELTRDLFLTYGETHRLPPPFVMAETRADAERLAVALRSRDDASADALSRELADEAKASQTPVLPSRGERKAARVGATVARGGAGTSRR